MVMHKTNAKDNEDKNKVPKPSPFWKNKTQVLENKKWNFVLCHMPV